MDRSNDLCKSRSRKADLFIRVNTGKHLCISKDAIRKLGSPKELLFWWNKNNRVFLISPCCERSRYSVQIPDYFYRHMNGQRLRSRQLLFALQETLGLSSNTVIKVPGKYVISLNAIVFPLMNAELEVYSNEQ